MGQSPTETRSVKRLAIIAPDARSLMRQRAGLLSEILSRRHSILALVPEHDAAAIPALNERGLVAATFSMSRSTPQLLADGKTVTALAAQLSEWRPHVVLGYGAKPMLLSALAGKKAGVGRRVGLLTAVSPGLTADDTAAPPWGWRRLLRRGFKALDAVVCHNQGQLLRLQAQRLLRPALMTAVVPGAGVDLIEHAALPLPPIAAGAEAGLNFLMIARRDAGKGVITFCEAARRVRKSAPDTRFILAGPDGDLELAALDPYAGAVQILGDQPDVRPLIAAAHVVVVASWSEACPGILLEALAAGRPVIASDIAGCREAIDERVNGVLVAPRDADALADAMRSFIRHPQLNPAMARASRSKAERWFDAGAVNRDLVRTLGL